MNSTPPVPLGLRVEVQWVIDRPWLGFSWQWSDGRMIEQGPLAMEWPVQPTTREEWADVVNEALEMLRSVTMAP